MIFAFLIFYRVRPLTEADKKKATAGWEQFKKNLSKDVEIVAEYAHIWGTTYNGMITVESRDLSAFHDFCDNFRAGRSVGPRAFNKLRGRSLARPIAKNGS